MPKPPFFLGAAAAGAIGWAYARSERPELRVTRHAVPWPGLAEPRRIVHITDVHVGWSTPLELLDLVAERATAEDPALVVLTGDYVNVSLRGFSRMTAFLAKLPRPVVAVLGNHDHMVSAEVITERLTAAGATVLRNAWTEVAGLTVVGVDDGFSGNSDVERAFQGLPQGVNALVLTHFPPTGRAIARRGGRLVLTGHTHAGQFELPGGWTQRLARFTRLGDYLRGTYTLENGVRLYVNAGLGHARRGMRRGELCRPELAVFTLEPSRA